MNLFERVLFIVILSLCISSCHEKDYDIISEARKILLDKKEEIILEKKDIENKPVLAEKDKVISEKKKNLENKKSRILKSIRSISYKNLRTTPPIIIMIMQSLI